MKTQSTHDGEQLQRMVRESGLKVGAFASLMGVSRNTPNRWFDVPKHDDSLLIRSSQKLNMDASSYFPRLKTTDQPLPNTALFGTNEPQHIPSNSAPHALPESQGQLSAVQQKLIETLEKYNALLVEHNQVLRTLAHLTSGASISPEEHKNLAITFWSAHIREIQAFTDLVKPSGDGAKLLEKHKEVLVQRLEEILASIHPADDVSNTDAAQSLHNMLTNH